MEVQIASRYTFDCSNVHCCHSLIDDDVFVDLHLREWPRQAVVNKNIFSETTRTDYS